MPQSSDQPLAADLRVRTSGAAAGTSVGEIVAVRLAPSLDWSPVQRLYFEATAGAVTLTEVDDLNADLSGQIEGFYRPPASPDYLQREADFRFPPFFGATLELALRLSLPTPGATVLQVTGSLILSSPAFASDFGVTRLEATVGAGEARLFPHDLPAVDLSGAPHTYFLELLPLLVQGHATPATPFNSTATLLTGAIDLWVQCGIKIIPATPAPFVVATPIADALVNGHTDPLIAEIQSRVRRGGGVPVAFVHPLFAQGGGDTSDHGVQRAIVVVTDQSAGNKTLLAHEVGHVLGGKEVGSLPAATYWVGKSGTIMDATGDVAHPAPAVVDDFTCSNARKFARWRRVL